MERECTCSATKQFRFVFDGGHFGNYSILVCKECYAAIDKEFLVKEEKL